MIWNLAVLIERNYIKTSLMYSIATMYCEFCRMVSRDIGGSDPERMAPPRVEDYLVQVFPKQPKDGVTLTVIKDVNTLNKEYPLFAAVNRAANQIERHRGRIVQMMYEGKDPKETIILVGKGVTFDTGGANIKVLSSFNFMTGNILNSPSSELNMKKLLSLVSFLNYAARYIDLHPRRKIKTVSFIRIADLLHYPQVSFRLQHRT